LYELEQEIKNLKNEIKKASSKVLILLNAIEELPCCAHERAAKKEALAERKEQEATLKIDLKELRAERKDLFGPPGMSRFQAVHLPLAKSPTRDLFLGNRPNPPGCGRCWCYQWR
jgi:hypothetical protein